MIWAKFWFLVSTNYSNGTSLHNLNSFDGAYEPNMNIGEYVFPKYECWTAFHVNGACPVGL